MSKAEIEKYINDCRELGWGVKPTTKGLFQLQAPSGDIIISPSASGGSRALGNFKAELRRAGFNAETVEVAKAEKAAKAIETDRKKNEAAMERAAKRAQEAAVQEKPKTKAAVVAPIVNTNPFTPPPVVNVGQQLGAFQGLQVLAGYPREAVFITQAQAVQLSEQKQCRQRNRYNSNVAKLKLDMELGNWELNPADSLVLDEHGCLVNGQHRMKALSEADKEFIDEFYTDGVPFFMTTGFPSALAHIFDTGKARSAADALAVEGLRGWNMLQTGGLRMAMNYDRSFMAEGEKNWPLWRNAAITNSELVAAVADGYGGILDQQSTATRAYIRAKVTRSAAMVASFVIERDNPGGSEKHTNEDFWKGICGEADMRVGDPRMAMARFSLRQSSKYRPDSGPATLAVLLECYADFHMGRPVEMYRTNRDVPMVAVWRPGMRRFGRELRHSKKSS